MNDVSDLAPGEEFVLSKRAAEADEATISRHGHVPLSRLVAGMVASDIVGSILVAWVVFRLYAVPLHQDSAQLWVGIFGFFVAWPLAASTKRLYQKATVLADLRAHCVKVMSSWVFAFGVVLLLGFAVQVIGATSRLWFLSWALGVLIWLTCVRYVWSRYLSAVLGQGGCFERVMVLTDVAYRARAVGEEIRRESGGRIGIVSTGTIPIAADDPSNDRIERAVRSGTIDRVVIAGFEAANGEIGRLLARLARSVVDVTVIPDIELSFGGVLNVDRIGTLTTIDLSLRPLTAFQLALKRAEDLILASLILLATAPVFLLVAIAIRLDSRGPVLFRQQREGFHDHVFRVWKFRTMFDSATDHGAVRQTSRGDDRVTRVGRLLRRFSIDELPQLLNVLSGDMSIVGPRPHPLRMTTEGLSMWEAHPEYASRQRLKPGITGLAQVGGCRGAIDSSAKLRRRVALDCQYIDNWSLSLDLWIILRTVALLIFDTEAY
jgi:Undecaprenyl-phosphate glucose phosphotransferase